MKPVVDVAELLDVLYANRDNHRLVFQAALEGWQRAAREHNDRVAAALSAGKYPELSLNLPLPQDHTRDYDRAVRMLNMHQEKTIELSEADAAHYIQDDWDWKRQWLGLNSKYAAATVSKVYGEGEEEDW